MYRFCRHISWQTLDNQLFLFDERTGETFALEGTACEMCLALAFGEKPDDIVDKISTKYNVNQSTVKDDLSSFCCSLIDSEVLEELHNE